MQCKAPKYGKKWLAEKCTNTSVVLKAKPTSSLTWDSDLGELVQVHGMNAAQSTEVREEVEVVVVERCTNTSNVAQCLCLYV